MDASNTGPSVPVQVQEPTPDDSLLKTINAALLPTIPESPIVTTATAVANVSSSVNITSHNPLQVSSEVMPMQALAQDSVNLQQQVQQVEQVVAHAQQQVEQVC